MKKPDKKALEVEEIILQCVDMLLSPIPTVRDLAAIELGGIDNRDSTTMLVHAYEAEENALVRRSIVDALSKHRNEDSKRVLDLFAEKAEQDTCAIIRRMVEENFRRLN